MNIFIFEDLQQVSNNYHKNGGLVIVAWNIENAKKLVEPDEYIKITDEEWNNVITYELKHDEEEKYYVFPDAGCC